VTEFSTQIPGFLFGALLTAFVSQVTTGQRLTRVETQVQELRRVVLDRSRAHRREDDE
jgi:Tfp pilus assembly protein PilN